VGKQDQYIAAIGGLSFLAIAVDGTVTVNRLLLTNHQLAELHANLLLLYTSIQQRSLDILEDQKRDTAEAREDVVESLHRTKELGLQIKNALVAGDLNRFGELLDVHWHNKKRRSSNISESTGGTRSLGTTERSEASSWEPEAEGSSYSTAPMRTRGSCAGR